MAITQHSVDRHTFFYLFRTINEIIQILRSQQWKDWVRHLDLNTKTKPTYEKVHSTVAPIYIPYLERELECLFTANIVYSRKSFIPLVVNVTMQSEVMFLTQTMKPNFTISL